MGRLPSASFAASSNGLLSPNRDSSKSAGAAERASAAAIGRTAPSGTARGEGRASGAKRRNRRAWRAGWRKIPRPRRRRARGRRGRSPRDRGRRARSSRKKAWWPVLIAMCRAGGCEAFRGARQQRSMTSWPRWLERTSGRERARFRARARVSISRHPGGANHDAGAGGGTRWRTALSPARSGTRHALAEARWPNRARHLGVLRGSVQRRPERVPRSDLHSCRRTSRRMR